MRALLVCGTAALAACSMQMNVPPGFLRLTSQERGDLRALSADGARIWVREFRVDDGAEVDYWAHAIAVDLTAARGYQVGDATDIIDGAGRKGLAFEGTTVVAGQRCGYLVAVFVLPAGWLPFSHDHVRTVEFAAPAAEFQADLDAVRAAVATLR